jgi:hypothetical protein
VVMSSSSSAPGASSDGLGSGLQHGLQLVYDRQLGKSEHFRWGLEAGFGFTQMCIHDDQPLTGAVTRISDAFSLGTPPIIAPTAPYNGTFAGPGAVIGDSPTRTINTISSGPGSASITGERSLSADVYSLQLGPYIEWPAAKRLQLSLSGGLALVAVDSDFHFQETVTIPGVGSQSSTGGGSHAGLLPGGFVAANLAVPMTHSLAFYAGAQYMNVGNYSHMESGREAKIDFGTSIFVNLGLRYSF